MMKKDTVVLLAAIAVSVQAVVDQLMVTNARDASGLERLKVLENMVRTQARFIEDLISRLEYLESTCSPAKVSVALGDAENENEAVDQGLEFAQGRFGRPADKHTVFVRADDSDPLIPVVMQLTERVNEVSASVQTLKNEVSASVQTLKNEVSASVQTLQNEMIEASTSVFVHWGSLTCPNSASLVYSGAAGGANYNYPGSAVNYLCLPLSDVVLVDGTGTNNAYLYGAEYQTGDGHNDKDPVCAVCRSPRPTAVMIPATTVCPAGWTVEYSGLLMGGSPADTGASEFVCMDSKMEERQGSDANDNGRLFYYTYTQCGSLPCPPYVTGKKVTCVVCSK